MSTFARSPEEAYENDAYDPLLDDWFAGRHRGREHSRASSRPSSGRSRCGPTCGVDGSRTRPSSASTRGSTSTRTSRSG